MQYTDPHHIRLIKISSYASVFVALTIIIIKAIGWMITDSMAILASLADSLLDVMASIINLAAIQYALMPPDDDHRFGHGKAEDLAVFVQSTLSAISGIFIIITSIGRIIHPEDLLEESIGVFIMIVSVSFTMVLVVFQQYVIRQTMSRVVQADSMHYVLDLLTNLFSIIALYLSDKYGLVQADSISAVLIAGVILIGAYKLWRTAFNNLMDREFDDEGRNKIIDILQKTNKIKGFHDLKTRYSGSRPIIQLHIEMDGATTLKEAHIASSEIEKMILSLFPNADLIIHQDPEGENDIRYKD